MTDPALYALMIGFGLVLFGLSPFAQEPGVRDISGDAGCLCIVSGIAVVLLTTLVKVLAA